MLTVPPGHTYRTSYCRFRLFGGCGRNRGGITLHHLDYIQQTSPILVTDIRSTDSFGLVVDIQDMFESVLSNYTVDNLLSIWSIASDVYRRRTLEQ